MTDLLFPTAPKLRRKAAAALRREKPLNWKAGAKALAQTHRGLRLRRHVRQR